MIDGLKIDKISLTPDARLRIMETAINAGHTHGIGYWADVTQVKRTSEDRIGAICVLERDPETKPDLTILGANNALLPSGGQGKGGQMWLNGEIMERAVARMLADPKGTESTGWTEALMTYDAEDGPLADVIIQVACFGKVIYA